MTASSQDMGRFILTLGQFWKCEDEVSPCLHTQDAPGCRALASVFWAPALPAEKASLDGPK